MLRNVSVENQNIQIDPEVDYIHNAQKMALILLPSDRRQSETILFLLVLNQIIRGFSC